MNALFISNDPALFDETSSVRARMRTYAAAIGTLHIVSAAPSGAADVAGGPLALYAVHAPRVFRIWALARRARKLIREKNIEIVSAQDPFEHGRAAWKAAKGTGVPLHVQIHTDFLSPHFAEESFKNRIRIRMADRLLPVAAGIRVVSERIKHSLMKRYGEKIVEPVVLPIAVLGGLPIPEPLPNNPFTFSLIMLGRIEPEKRIQDMLMALAEVRRRYQNTGLFIVGGGRLTTSLMRLVEDSGLHGNVVFMGERPDARRFLETATAYFQTSAYEGYGRSLLEAALARRPIITTDVGIVGEVFVPERDVLACPVGDHECLVREITRLIEDNPLRKVLADNAEAAAKAHLAKFADLPRLVADDLAHAAKKSVATTP